MAHNIYKIVDINIEKIWGSKRIDDKTIGEIVKFEINEARSNDVLDSQGNSYNLYQLYSSPKRELIFGSKYNNIDKFPFLVKYICSSQKLSVQVHPKEKKETWLFLKDNSKILLGLKDDIQKDQLSVKSLLDNSNIIEMPKYGFAVVEPGTIHSILEDNVVCEVQNNYDVTYRYYDWDNNRKLTQDEFIENASFNKYDLGKNTWKDFKEYDSENFRLERITIHNEHDFPKVDCCRIIIVLEGNGVLSSSLESFVINSNESYLITANVDYKITGDLDILIVS